MEYANILIVERTLDLLLHLDDGKEIKLDQAAKVLKLPRSQVECIARALSNKGFLLQDTQEETLRLAPKPATDIPRLENYRTIATPKGIDHLTLRKIKDTLGELPKGRECSSADLAALIGVTRITARRYLEFLMTEGVVHRRHYYEGVGRPIARYRVVGLD